MSSVATSPSVLTPSRQSPVGLTRPALSAILQASRALTEKRFAPGAHPLFQATIRSKSRHRKCRGPTYQDLLSYSSDCRSSEWRYRLAQALRL
eukprot:IDg23482t1